MIGNFGDAEIFSFHATKFLNTLEGGAVVTNNDELVHRIRRMRNFGFAKGGNVVNIGTNGKMNEISAAMGLTGLESLKEFIAVNLRNYKHYERELRGIPGVQLMKYNEREKSNYQCIVLTIHEDIVDISRDNLVRVLHAENVLAKKYFHPCCHNMEPYQADSLYAGLQLRNTDLLAERVISLPTGTAIEPEQISQICEIIRFAVEHGREINAELETADSDL